MKVLVIIDSKLIRTFTERILKKYTTDIHFIGYDKKALKNFLSEQSVDLTLVYETDDCKSTRSILDLVFLHSAEMCREEFRCVLIRRENSYDKVDYTYYKEYGLEGKLVTLIYDELEINLSTYIENNFLDRDPLQGEIKLTRGGFPILLVDDSPVVRKAVGDTLRGLGFRVLEAEDGLEALDCFKKRTVKMIITDVEMPNMSGLELCERIREINDYVEILVISSISHHETIDMAYKIGAGDFFIKPLNMDKLVRKVEMIYESVVEKSRYKILLVDDDRFVREKLKGELEKNSLDVITACNGVEGLAKAVVEKPSVIITDVEMPHMDGYDLLAAIKDFKPLEQASRIMMSGAFHPRKMKANTNDITIQFYSKPFDTSNLIMQIEQIIFNKMSHFKREHSFFISSIKSLIIALEERDEYTKGHSERVTEYAVMTGKELGLTSHQLSLVELSASLHDIGKIGVKDAVLFKPGALTPDEFEIIKGHCVLGARIIEQIESLKRVSQIVQCHHERMDGKGYPVGLMGFQIPIEAKIIAVADSYDAMISKRPYRDPLSESEAKKILTEVSGTQLDESCVRAFLAGLKD